MKILFEKLIKILKNIGVCFLSYMIMYLVFSGLGIVKAPIMLNQYTNKNNELVKLQEDLNGITYESVYEKYSKKILEKEKDFKNLENKKSKLKNEIEYLNSRLNIKED